MIEIGGYVNRLENNYEKYNNNFTTTFFNANL